MDTSQCDRRTVLRAAGAIAVGASAGLAGCNGSSGGGGSTTTSSGGGGTSYDGWFGGSTGGATDNYDGSTVDETGQDAVTIRVGADGNGGTYAFAPPAVKLSSGTTVTFKWVSSGHNIEIQAQPSDANWQGEGALKNDGYTDSHTFGTAGTYKYYCRPHLSLGMKGAIVVV